MVKLNQKKSLYLLPHGADGIGLSKLNNNGSRSSLMTSVSRVPVVVGGVAVEKGISRSTNAFDDDGRHWNRGDVLTWN